MRCSRCGEDKNCWKPMVGDPICWDCLNTLGRPTPPAEVDTKEIRKAFKCGPGIHSEAEFDLYVWRCIERLCDEVDTLRNWRTAFDEKNKECNQLTAKLARLREQAGVKVCRKCGAYEYVHHVSVEVDQTAHGGQRPVVGDFCQTCLDRALDALRGK